MSAEIAPLRTLTRRVKHLALKKAEAILANPKRYSKEVYNQTYLTVLKNVVPRTQELKGANVEHIVTSEEDNELANKAFGYSPKKGFRH